MPKVCINSRHTPSLDPPLDCQILEVDFIFYPNKVMIRAPAIAAKEAMDCWAEKSVNSVTKKNKFSHLASLG